MHWALKVMVKGLGFNSRSGEKPKDWVSDGAV